MSHTAIELFHIALGLLAACVLTYLCAWSYPLGRQAIWWCGAAAMAATVAMGARPLRRAWAKDKSER